LPELIAKQPVTEISTEGSKKKPWITFVNGIYFLIPADFGNGL